MNPCAKQKCISHVSNPSSSSSSPPPHTHPYTLYIYKCQNILCPDLNGKTKIFLKKKKPNTFRNHCHNCHNNFPKSSMEEKEDGDISELPGSSAAVGSAAAATAISGATASAVVVAGPPPIVPQIIPQMDDDEISQLVKLSCHDSGIDIRDPNQIVQPIPAKKVYSDADIVLSSDWVPPITIAPTLATESTALSAQAAAQAHNLDQGGRKKTSSVSFSVEDNESVAAISDKGGETKKNKVSNGVG